MRKLPVKRRAFAAESIAIAYSHLNTAQKLIKHRDYSGGVSRLYYAAFFAAKASLADLGNLSSKHKYWVGKLNQRYGQRNSWLPKRYVALLNTLLKLREDHDYRANISINKETGLSYLRRSGLFIECVKRNTPLVHYPEFIQEYISGEYKSLAFEFDIYCPKSYLHKERVQFQIKAENYDTNYIKKVYRAGKDSIRTLGVARQEDYVLGWNNRFGQGANGYLLFLDLDIEDEAKIKSLLKNNRGWLFKSGQGYHFISREMCKTQKQWLNKFNKAVKSQQLKNMIDRKHFTFSKRRGYSTLRMTSSTVKKFKPFLCWDNSLKK